MPTQRIKELAQREAEHLFTLQPIKRPWHLIVTAAMTIASTIFIGAIFDQLPLGIMASLGAMIILNQPSTGNLYQRQGLLFVLGLLMVGSFSMGLVAHNLPMVRTPIFVVITFVIVLLSRYLRLTPPSGMFILMAAVIALFMPVSWAQMPFHIGIVSLGAIFAWGSSLVYNLIMVRPDPMPAPKRRKYEQGLITESVVVTTFVVLALEVALWLDMPYPYWVPVSSYIIMLGTHLRTMWIKQLHRIIGTAIGIVVAWFLLALPLSNMGVVLAILLMFLWIEGIIARHYALAVIMITPLTIFIAEYGGGQSDIAGLGPMAYRGIIEARFLDTVLGCLIALLGGVVMHSTWLRQPLMSFEAKLFGNRLNKDALNKDSQSN
ncbi:FUSC family protein [Psychrobacter sp. FDAARGOS_221]|uniref:FUSC family protein n=1 Tax=Psychrobacter sp. FDAARGOS_221 TaxID=1975705 RepID=UPI000BB5717C|nr:FUSC family protein [Psychrobacter sp. FDAARGOS_221]PNK60625.1 FUSC family protein [Psychrobacter sp. FDAARGOS_221]